YWALSFLDMAPEVLRAAPGQTLECRFRDGDDDAPRITAPESWSSSPSCWSGRPRRRSRSTFPEQPKLNRELETGSTYYERPYFRLRCRRCPGAGPTRPVLGWPAVDVGGARHTPGRLCANL